MTKYATKTPRAAGEPDASTTGPSRLADLTIEDLTLKAGTSTRNIRAFQSLGLLAGPRLVGRRGFYDQSHVDRVVLIRKLQQRGYKLAAIRDLLAHWNEGAGLGEVLELQSAVAAPMTHDAQRQMSRAEVEAAIAPIVRDARLLERAIRHELLARDGDAWLVPSVTLLNTARDLLGLGVSPGETLDELERMRSDGERVAGRMRGIFQRTVFEPFARAGFPAERLTEVTDAVRRLRAMAVAAITVVFTQAIERGEAVAPPAPPPPAPAAAVRSAPRSKTRRPAR